MKIHPLRTALLLAGILALPTCGGSPDGAVMQVVGAMQDNDLETVLSCVLTQAQLAEARAEWSSQMLETPGDEERAQFAMTMAMLTAPDAEEALMLKVEPELAKMRPQMEMMLGMVESMAAGAITSNESLTALEQQEAQQAVQALVTTLRQNDLTDPGRARKAVGIVCKTARKLELKSVEDVQRLSFAQALARGDVLLAGLKDVLDVYGFSIDDVLDSVRARTVSESGDVATVEIRYTLLGVQHTQQTEMQRVAGRWVIRRDEAGAPTELRSGFGG